MTHSAVVQVLIGIALLASSVALVYVEHLHREMYVELRALERERDDLEVEWGKLQLEQSTWATHDRIEREARQKLGLRTPPVSEIVLVTP